MLLVQQYLRSGKTLADLQIEHGVKNFCQNGKVNLNYDQIEAKDSDPLSQQCRGLILRENTFDVVAAPMFRFFNMEQVGVAASVDWSTASFEEKMDGTLLICYFDHILDRWFVGTRGRPEADVLMDDSGFTFTSLMDHTLKSIFGPGSNLQTFMNGHDRNKTYCFELTTPVNRIVCQYDDFNLTLLAVRDNGTLKEENPRPDEFGLVSIKTYSFSGNQNLIEIIRGWDPKDHEGVVVKDANFNRVKVKSPAYVAYNHMRDSLSTSVRGCLEIILLGKDDDVIGMLPDFIAQRLVKLKSSVAKLITQTQQDYQEIKDISDMKEFALTAQTKPWPAALFALKRGKAKDIQDFLHGKEAGIPNSTLDSVLALCRKVDPDLSV